MTSHPSRRRFLQQLSLGAASVGLTALDLRAAPPRGALREIGIILGFMREAMQADPVGMLETIAATGYRQVEYQGYFGLEPTDFRAHLRRLGLRAVAGGATMRQLREELPRVIDESLADGKEFVVCYWPWLDGGEHLTLRDIHTTADRFNELGAVCRQAGLRFAFHNHGKEFDPIEGRIPYEIFLTETDPALVAMQIDLYWIQKGGGDVLDTFARHPGRFPICHVKDMDRTAERGFEIPGQGVIDFARIFAQAPQAGLEYFIVEQDNAPDPLRTIRESYAYLRRLRF
jgi:sugar phosphate isomerase/epimerase